MFTSFKWIATIMALLLLVSCDPEPSSNGNEEKPGTVAESKVDSVAITPNSSGKVKNENGEYQLPYDLKSWKKKVELDKGLTEISGLEYKKENEELLGINDESGKLYNLDPHTGGILNVRKFSGSGDYEGITKHGDQVYVVKSTGTLYSFGLSNPKKATKMNTPLSGANDVEGLATDTTQSRLLLACKGSPLPGKYSFDQSFRGIYAFDLKTQSLVMEPAYTIKDEDLVSYVDRHYASKKKKTLEKYKKRAAKLAPSALAFHPITDNLYVLSSVGKLLVILNRAGDILHVEMLNDKDHYQPEGICFAENGDLFISNEGKSKPAKIYWYSQN